MRLASNVIPLKREAPKPIKRKWVVIARDKNNVWRVRQIRAYDAEGAKAAYEKLFTSYQVMGVGKLDSSGWPVTWYGDNLPPK